MSVWRISISRKGTGNTQAPGAAAATYPSHWLWNGVTGLRLFITVLTMLVQGTFKVHLHASARFSDVSLFLHLVNNLHLKISISSTVLKMNVSKQTLGTLLCLNRTILLMKHVLNKGDGADAVDLIFWIWPITFSCVILGKGLVLFSSSNEMKR